MSKNTNFKSNDDDNKEEDINNINNIDNIIMKVIITKYCEGVAA